jgi:hypothetical protein
LHSTRLKTDIACVPVFADRGIAARVVQHCLSLSQVVLMPTPSRGASPTLSTTWRKCQSYTCSDAGEALAREVRRARRFFPGRFRCAEQLRSRRIICSTPASHK